MTAKSLNISNFDLRFQKLWLSWHPENVVRAAQAGSFESLSKAGAYIRGIAARSIGKSDEASEPGKPPHTREGQLKKSILFKVSTDGANVVIGPTRTGVGLIGNSHEFGGTEGPKKPPAAREANWKLRIGGHGPIRIIGGYEVAGYAKLTTDRQVERATRLAPIVQRLSGAAYTQSLVAYWKSGAAVNRKYPPRPFMGPALERSKERLPQLWANSIRGG
jgi:hypothetical protein